MRFDVRMKEDEVMVMAGRGAAGEKGRAQGEADKRNESSRNIKLNTHKGTG